MANQPALTATVRITAVDVNGNSVAKNFLAVTGLRFDYAVGKVNIIDATGSFYFSLLTITSLTYTVVTGIGGSHTVVMS